MKKYVNAKAEIYKLDAGDIMITSIQNLSFDVIGNETYEGDNNYANWGNWNSND